MQSLCAKRLFGGNDAFQCEAVRRDDRGGPRARTGWCGADGADCRCCGQADVLRQQVRERQPGENQLPRRRQDDRGHQGCRRRREPWSPGAALLAQVPLELGPLHPVEWTAGVPGLRDGWRDLRQAVHLAQGRRQQPARSGRQLGSHGLRRRHLVLDRHGDRDRDHLLLGGGLLLGTQFIRSGWPTLAGNHQYGLRLLTP